MMLNHLDHEIIQINLTNSVALFEVRVLDKTSLIINLNGKLKI